MVAYYIIAIVATTGANGQLYQWSCSPLDVSNNRFTLPDLGYGSDENVARLGTGNVTLSGGFLDIYLVPSTLNCSGIVSAVEHCYVGSTVNPINFGETNLIFTLLILQQSGPSFTVTNVIDIQSTVTAMECTDVVFSTELTLRYCCDSMPLGMTEFRLPSSEFALGVVPGTSLNSLSYRPEVFPQFRVERFSVDSSSIPALGSTITLSDADRNTDSALRLMQLAICKHYGCAWSHGSRICCYFQRLYSEH